MIALAVLGAGLSLSVPALAAWVLWLRFQRETRVTVSGESIATEMQDLRNRIQKLEMAKFSSR